MNRQTIVEQESKKGVEVSQAKACLTCQGTRPVCVVGVAVPDLPPPHRPQCCTHPGMTVMPPTTRPARLYLLARI